MSTPPFADLDDFTPQASRLAVLLDHFALIEDPRDVRRILHPLNEILLLVTCGTIANCDDYEDIADWGEEHVDFLRGFLPYANGVPGERWLTILMNRINPALFSAAFSSWVRACWPGRPDLVAIDGKTSRRSHDRAAGKAPLHLVSAFASTAGLVLAQEAVPEKASELAAIPVLLEELGADGGLKGALVTIDAIATNAAIAGAIMAQGADYLLAVKANQPGLQQEIEAAFIDADAQGGTGIDSHTTHDKGHGRIETRRMSVMHDTGWLAGPRRFPGEPRLPAIACLLRAEAQVERGTRTSHETRWFISSRPMTAEAAAAAVRAHWAIENRLHWVLDVTFREDLSRLRKGHGARNMAVVRHFALNLVRKLTDRRALKRRRKRASWNLRYLESILMAEVG